MKIRWPGATITAGTVASYGPGPAYPSQVGGLLPNTDIGYNILDRSQPMVYSSPWSARYLKFPADLCAQVAQLVEQWTENPRVGGSSPPLGTIPVKGAAVLQCPLEARIAVLSTLQQNTVHALSPWH